MPSVVQQVPLYIGRTYVSNVISAILFDTFHCKARMNISVILVNFGL